MRLLSFKSRGSEVRCSGNKRDDGRYDLVCEVIEKGATLLRLSVIIDTKYQLDKMMYNFNERPRWYTGV